MLEYEVRLGSEIIYVLEIIYYSVTKIVPSNGCGSPLQCV